MERRLTAERVIQSTPCKLEPKPLVFQGTLPDEQFAELNGL